MKATTPMSFCSLFTGLASIFRGHWFFADSLRGGWNQVAPLFSIQVYDNSRRRGDWLINHRLINQSCLFIDEHAGSKLWYIQSIRSVHRENVGDVACTTVSIIHRQFIKEHLLAVSLEESQENK